MAKQKPREDGRYRHKIYVGRKEVGSIDTNKIPTYKKEYIYVYGRTQKEVDKKRDDLKVKLGKGIDVNGMRDTFSVWANRFLSGKKAEGIGLSHIKNLERFITHFQTVENTAIGRIEIAELQDIINQLAVQRGEKSPLSNKTLQGIKQAGSGVFRLAIASRAIEYNPMEFVRIPKTTPATTREPIQEQQKEWIENTPHRAQRAAMIMLYAGLRKGECVALTRPDIDLLAQEITVSKAVTFDESGQPRIKSTKTEAGIRVVRIPTKLVDFLRDDLRNDDCMYITHTASGKMPSKISWQRMWDSYMKDLNVKYGYTREAKIQMGLNPEKEVKKSRPGGLLMLIKPFTPHMLRHTYATMLYFAGVDVLTARDQLGHSDIKTTLSIYTHLDKRHKRTGMEKLDAYLIGGSQGGHVEEKQTHNQ